MVGFFNLKSAALRDQIATGNAIIKLCKSVNQDTPTSEWKKFKDDPRGWLHTVGYRYDGPDAGPNGEIPPSINIVPVYDTADTMHVRVPFAGFVENPPDIHDEQSYGANGPNRFPTLLARYFMRQCR